MDLFPHSWSKHARWDLKTKVVLRFWVSTGSAGGFRGCRRPAPHTWAPARSDSTASGPRSGACTLWRGRGAAPRTPAPRPARCHLHSGQTTTETALDLALNSGVTPHPAVTSQGLHHHGWRGPVSRLQHTFADGAVVTRLPKVQLLHNTLFRHLPGIQSCLDLVGAHRCCSHGGDLLTCDRTGAGLVPAGAPRTH